VPRLNPFVLFNLLAILGATSMKHAIISLADDRDHVRTATPVKHLVVIFQEDISCQGHKESLDESARDNGKIFPGPSRNGNPTSYGTRQSMARRLM
jgi:hypothetical protein